MTARTCSVHGEYCPDGTCRWCEETVQPEYVQPVAHAPAPLPIQHVGVDELVDRFAEDMGCPPTYCGVPVVVDPYAAPDAIPILVNWGVPPAAGVMRDAVAMLIVEWCRLGRQHASLRWERVARRWEGKGLNCTVLGHDWDCDPAAWTNAKCERCGLRPEVRT